MITTTHLRLVLILLVLSNALPIAAQQQDSTLLQSFKTYTQTPREQVYLHLNKSSYIKSEALGFQAYILDKNLKTLSNATSNLYVVIEDQNGKAIKEGLYQVNEGIANGVVDIDSSFSTGRYQIKGYTNWMRNFDEYNYHIESFNVIDLNNQIPPKQRYKELDLQLVAEGGHFVSGVNQFAGIVAKYSDGSIAEFEDGVVLSQDGTVLSTFTTNSRGHAKVLITTDSSTPIKAKLNNHDTYSKTSEIKSKGLVLNIIDLSDRLAVKISTNSKTLPDLQNKRFELSIHNGSLIKVLDFEFNSKTDLARVIRKSDLYPGINVFTLFDESKHPIVERLFFNNEGISTADVDPIDNLTASSSRDINGTTMDSLEVFFKIKNYKSGSQNKLSASVLPKGTKSYNKHHNLLSAVYLQPYLKHYVNDGQYFFKESNPQRLSDLDLFLLTEGWGSYEWNTIFNNQSLEYYAFERGITVKVNVPRKQYDTFVLYTTQTDESSAITLPKEQTYFDQINLFPETNEKLQIAALDKKNKPKKAGFAPVFFPRSIPKLISNYRALPLEDEPFFEYPLENDYLNLSSEGYETLEEIILYANYRKEKIRKTYRKGDIIIFDDELRKEFFELGPFLRSQGFTYSNAMNRTFNQAEYGPSRFNESPRLRYRITSYPITDTQIFIDDIRVWAPWDAIIFETDAIDYVVVDKKLNMFGVGTSGMGEFSGNPYNNDDSWYMAAVYVHTNKKTYLNKMDAKLYNQYDFPLTFQSGRSFYTPRYPTFNQRFFKDYGVLNWEANIEPNDSGVFSIMIPATFKGEVTVFLEGIINDSQLLSEQVDLEILTTRSN